jgi:transposase
MLFYADPRPARPSDAVAVARKLTVLCWHLLTKGEDYQWARPALVANKTPAMQLQAGHPQQKGSRRGPAYAYNIKSLRNREMLIAAQAGPPVKW